MITTKSLAVSTFTMPAALAAADALLGTPDWQGHPDNQPQVAWLSSFRRRAELARTMEAICSNATERVDEHVSWLAAQGWEAQVTQGRPGDLFLAATLNVVARWKETGKAYEEDGVPRVLLKKGCYLSEVAGRHPMVEVVTQHEGYNFCFQQMDVAPANTAELAALALEMVSREARDAVHLDFPMVDLLARDGASHMIGLHAGQHFVSQAAEQLRLELNEVGGRASAAAEVAVSLRGVSAPPRVIKIDGSFIVAINRNGSPSDAEKVVFAAYCDRDVWGRPSEGRI